MFYSSGIRPCNEFASGFAITFELLFFSLVASTNVSAAPCVLSTASPSVTICNPTNASTISSPVTVTAGTTDNAHPVTAMIVYVDNNNVYKVNANQLNTSLSMSPGKHNITINAWDSSGAVFKGTSLITVTSSSGGNGSGCSPSSTSPSVTICSPASGATVTSPVQVSAAGRSSTSITKMLVYIDNQLQLQTTTANNIQTSVAIANGTHNLTVQFYNGSWVKQSESFTVSGGIGGSSGKANVLTWHYDNERTGLNPGETSLTLANVNPAGFGKLFSYLVDGYIYAQPLYVSNLTIAGASHNVVFVATENDTVYAFNADNYGSGAPLWQRSLLETGETPATGSIKPVLGITSTPVIDAASETMYVVSTQKSVSDSFFRLHALDLATGAEKFGGPVVIHASVPGTSSDSVNGELPLTTTCVQRAALLLADDTVFIGFGGCHSGWLLSYDSQSLAQTGVFNSSPNIDGYGEFGGAGGIWMGGGGPAADGDGSIYAVTGNGPYDGDTSFGDSVLKFNAQLKLLDHFTPADWAFLQCRDADLSAGGLILIPGASRALVGGKTGEMYLLNTASLGGEKANDLGTVQSLWFEQDISPAYSTTCTDNKGTVLTGEVTGYQIYGTAAFFNGSSYLGVMPSVSSVRGPVRQFIYNGQLFPAAVTPDSIAPNSYGTTPFISANGTSNGIVWVLDHGLPIQDPDNVAATHAVLRAYNASNLAQELYNSNQNSADVAGLGIKFTSPIVANGKVFIGTGHDPATATNPRGELDVYGLK